MKLIVVIAIVAAIWWLMKRNRRPRLSIDEARELLDVRPHATRDEIAAAHRRLIARVHPDAGGSAALAKRVNAARDLLLAQP